MHHCELAKLQARQGHSLTETADSSGNLSTTATSASVPLDTAVA